MSKRPETEIAHRAAEVLQNLTKWKLPVDPSEIAREEEIELAPGEFKSGFDGRIRYLPEVDTYVLAYRVAGPGRSVGRVNFTIAHELGHYYLHRDYLRSGRSHSSEVDFRSSDDMEQEADEFAAGLLMPVELFRKAVSEFRQNVCTLRELCQLSDRLGTSVTSTVRRYCQVDIEPAAAVFSEGGQIRWAVFSGDMRSLGMGYVPFGSEVPPGTVTKRALMRSEDFADGKGPAYTWFDHPRYDGNVWEEAMRLGETSLTVTYLTLCEDPWHDSED